MQSAWSEGWARLGGRGGDRYDDPRRPRRRLGWIPRQELVTVALIVLMMLLVGQSTVAMAWVHGSEVFVRMGVYGALLLGLFALVRPLPAAVGVVLLVAGAAVVPWYANQQALAAAHPAELFYIPPPGTWEGRITHLEQTDVSLILWLGSVLFWVAGGWLALSAIRWRQTLLGLAPATLIVATNILNSHDEQNGFTLGFLFLALALLLWTGFRAAVERALERGMRMTADSRWDFWETGIALGVVVMLLALFVPPYSHQDQTVSFESGAFRDWAQLQQNMARPVAIGSGAALTSTGFSLDTHLNAPLKRSERPVFTYTYSGQYAGPRYFRGATLVAGARRGEWTYVGNPYGVPAEVVAKGRPYLYSSSSKDEVQGTFKVHMLRPPNQGPDLLFYPGELLKSDRDTSVTEVLRTMPPTGVFQTVDEVHSLRPPSSSGFYTVQVVYPNATVTELQAAPAEIPDWIQPYTYLPPFQFGVTPLPQPPPGPGLPADSLDARVRALANELTRDQPTVYDKAVAIQDYLRANYQYTLTPPIDPARDPIDNFLFNSKQGYCEYFAAAMGFLLRAEGIPSRVVSGYGPGDYDSSLKQYVVRERDAHMWVEVYFPGIGWTPFEPTPDGNYFPVARASVPTASCVRDNCQTGDESVPGESVPGAARNRGPRDLPGDLPSQSGDLTPQASPLPWILAGVLLALVAAAVLLVMRLLRPRDAFGAWRRLQLLTGLAGLAARPGETPAEFGRRLAAALPEGARPLRELADGFSVAAYAPPPLAAAARARVMEAWEEARPHLLRRIAARLRPAW